jgi:hypothetical protein
MRWEIAKILKLFVKLRLLLNVGPCIYQTARGGLPKTYQHLTNKLRSAKQQGLFEKEPPSYETFTTVLLTAKPSAMG